MKDKATKIIADLRAQAKELTDKADRMETFFEAEGAEDNLAFMIEALGTTPVKAGKPTATKVKIDQPTVPERIKKVLKEAGEEGLTIAEIKAAIIAKGWEAGASVATEASKLLNPKDKDGNALTPDVHKSPDNDKKYVLGPVPKKVTKGKKEAA